MTSHIPRSNPTGLDFWGYIKDFVYSTPDLEDLHCRVVTSCATVTPEMLQNIWKDLENCLTSVSGTRGVPIEIYYILARISLHS